LAFLAFPCHHTAAALIGNQGVGEHDPTLRPIHLEVVANEAEVEIK